MHTHAPEAGLASLLASRGRNGDSVLVHMSPGEVQGLQALAMASGGSLTINPHTGLYEAGWLKKLLPMIAGAALNFLAPGLGSTIGGLFGATGTAATTLGTGLLVGGIEGLRTGSLKKGLMAGLGAYGGANIATSLSSAGAQTAAGEAAAKQALAKETAQKATEEYGLTEAIASPTFGTVSNLTKEFGAATPAFGTTPQLATVGQNIGVAAAPASTYAAPSIATGVKTIAAPSAAYTPYDELTGAIDTATSTAAAAAPTFANIGTGVKSLVTPAGRSAFMQGLGGGATSTLGQNASKYATLAAIANAGSPDQPEGMGEIPMGDDYVYIPGGFNPQYGSSRDQPYYLPGGYYKRTAQGLVPYDPYGKKTGSLPSMLNTTSTNPRELFSLIQQGPKGMAGGGVVPAPSDHYPMANIQHAAYATPSQDPRQTEMFSGYDTAVNPFTGEEAKPQVNFDVGGAVNGRLPFTDNSPPDPPPSRQTAADPQRTQMEAYYRSLLTPPSQPRSTTKLSNYLGNLEAGLQLPLDKFYPGGDPSKSAIPTTPSRSTAQGTGTGSNTEFWRTGGTGTGTGTSTDYGYIDPATGQWIWTRTPPNLNGGTAPTANTQTFTPGEVNWDINSYYEPNFRGSGTWAGIPTSQSQYDALAGVTGGNPFYSWAQFQNLRNPATAGTGAGTTFNPPEAKPEVSAPTIDPYARPGIDSDFTSPFADTSTAVTTPSPGQFYPGSGGRTYWEPSWNQGQGAWVDIPKTQDEWLTWDQQTGGGEFENGGSPMNFANPFRSNPNGTMRPVGSDYIQGAYGNWIDDPSTWENTLMIPKDASPEERDKKLAAAYAGMGTPMAAMANKTFAGGGAIVDGYNFGFASGGMASLPEYKAGGKLLDGPGDGMSDDIPAVIRGKQTQRAALADGEFVVPADVVSHLGNGSTKAGANKLYTMMDKVRQARTGTKRQAPRVKTDRYLPR